MPSNSFLFDTNIFIYYFNAEPSVEKLFSGDFISTNILYYSIITEIELLSFPKLSEDESKIIKGLL
ncbi:MAG: PIN domain nuclease, partial [Bacteroidota bacterium]